MPIDPTLQTPQGYATPQQLAAMREYSRYLLQQSGEPAQNPKQGMANVARALIGGLTQSYADTKEQKARAQWQELLKDRFDKNDLSGVIAAGASPWANQDAVKMAAAPLIPQMRDTGLGMMATDRFGNQVGPFIPKTHIGNEEVAPGVKPTQLIRGTPGGGAEEIPIGASGGAMARPAQYGTSPPSLGPEPSPGTVNPRTVGGQPQNLTGPTITPSPVRTVQAAPLSPAFLGKAAAGNDILADRARKDAMAKEGVKVTMTPLEEVGKEAKTAGPMLNDLNVVEDTVRRYGDKITTGPFANQALQFKQAGNSILKGITGKDDLLGDTAPAEIIKKMNAQLASAALPMFTNRGTQFDLKVFMDNNPGLNNSVQGTLFLTSILKQIARQNLELGQLAANPANHGNWFDVARKYYEDHPLINPLTGTALGVGKDTPAQMATTDSQGYTIVDGYRIKQR